MELEEVGVYTKEYAILKEQLTLDNKGTKIGDVSKLLSEIREEIKETYECLTHSQNFLFQQTPIEVGILDKENISLMKNYIYLEPYEKDFEGLYNQATDHLNIYPKEILDLIFRGEEITFNLDEDSQLVSVVSSDTSKGIVIYISFLKSEKSELQEYPNLIALSSDFYKLPEYSVKKVRDYLKSFLRERTCRLQENRLSTIVDDISNKNIFLKIWKYFMGHFPVSPLDYDPQIYGTQLLRDYLDSKTKIKLNWLV